MRIKRDLKLSEKKIVYGLVLLFSITIVTISLFGDKGYLELRALQVREKKLQEEIHALEDQRALWLKRLQSMHDNPTYIENIAREKLGFVRENEILFTVENSME